MQNLLVQKYGGASLATPEKLKRVAERVARAHAAGKKILVAVSAMGSSTDELIRLAQRISRRPAPRELDMLVSTGERVSMSLMSMALQELGVPAISFTGSQAGIITDEAHVSARIIDVRAHRVKEALEHGKVVVLAGFQGVSEVGKEITTLGRGGTDTTAIAMGAYLGAEKIEILKEVPGIMTADPRRVPGARLLEQLSIRALAEMTFWGAKVLHYRSVELAWQKKLEIFIGPASSEEGEGTKIFAKGESMLEQPRVLAVNAHPRVLTLEVKTGSPSASPAIALLHEALKKCNIATPQILLVEQTSGGVRFFVTAPHETLEELLEVRAAEGFEVLPQRLGVVTVTCIGSFGDQLLLELLSNLHRHGLQTEKISTSSMSLHFFLREQDVQRATEILHGP